MSSFSSIPSFAGDSRIGKFVLMKRLGRGGMGEVWLAEDSTLGRYVALKVILPEFALRDDIRSRFLQEARLASQVQHERIVQVFEVGEDRQIPYIAMELLRGEDLYTRLEREPIPSLSSALKIVAQVLHGLSAAHTHPNRLIHRDIKPQNVWLEKVDDKGKFRCKILDFGIAKSSEEGRHRTQSGMVIGTLDYMSAEQLNAEELDPRADLYSVGVMLYQMLTGCLPYQSRSAFQRGVEMFQSRPPTPKELNPSVPQALSDFTTRLMAVRREDRPTTAREAIQLLEAIVRASKGSTTNTSRAESRSTPVIPPEPRRDAEAPRRAPTGMADRQPERTKTSPTMPRTSGESRSRPPAPPKSSPGRLGGTRRRAHSREANLTTRVKVAVIIGVLGGLTLLVLLSVALTNIGGGNSGPTKDLPTELSKSNPKAPVEVAAIPPDQLDCTGERGADVAAVKNSQQEWAAHYGVPVETSVDLGGGVKAEFVLIPPGKFFLGTSIPDQSNLIKEFGVAKEFFHEQPHRIVSISRPFYLGKTEVTRAQFGRFLKATNAITQAEKSSGGHGWNSQLKRFEKSDKKYSWKETGWNADDSHPVVNVNWHEAVTMCRWIGETKRAELPKGFIRVRPPREAEWEYACRGGTRTRFSTGSDDGESLSRAGNIADRTYLEQFPTSSAIKAADGFAFTAPVGRFAPNALGLHDMHGNVWEWCRDSWEADAYKRQGHIDPEIMTSDDRRCIRGGCWNNTPRDCRSSTRNSWESDQFSECIGFRLVLALDH